MCRSLRSEIRHMENPQRYMWEPCWRAIPSIQSSKARLLLANHEDRLHGIRSQMRQVTTIYTDIESTSEGTYIHDQPVAIFRLNQLNWSTLQKKR